MPEPEETAPEEAESPEVVAHDGEEEQPLWCGGQASCGSKG
jgi:hypothetical protein